MLSDLRNEPLALVKANGKIVLFTDDRIDRNSVPPGLFCYDLRHGDDDSIPRSIENSVMVNHYGTILCKEPFDFYGRDYVELEDDLYFLNLPEVKAAELAAKDPLRIIVEFGMEDGSKQFCRVAMSADSGESVRLFIANTIECREDLMCYDVAVDFFSKLQAGTNVDVQVRTFMFGNGMGDYASKDELEYVRLHFDEMYRAKELDVVEHEDCHITITTGQEKEIRVLMVEPDKQPYTALLGNDLKSMQAAVGGYVECVSLDGNTALYCNEDGKLLGLQGNRRIGSDIIAGKFFLCGRGYDGDDISLTDEQIESYSARFAEPEHFVGVYRLETVANDNGIIIIRLDEQQDNDFFGGLDNDEEDLEL